MVRNTMSYSLGAAAAAIGLNKTSILRAIKSGKISGTKDALGQWWVEPAELHRVPKPAREHVRLVPDKIYPGMWRVVGGVWHALRYGQQNPGTGCGLASGRIHGLDPHLGSLSGCRYLGRGQHWSVAHLFGDPRSSPPANVTSIANKRQSPFDANVPRFQA